MRIRTKLLLNSLSLFFCLALVGSIGLFFTLYTANLSTSLVQTQTVPILKINSLEEDLWEMWSRFIVHSSVSDVEVMRQLENEIAQLQKLSHQKVEELNQYTRSNLIEKTTYLLVEDEGLNNRQQWETFDVKWQQFLKVTQEALKLSQDFTKNDALSLLMGEGRKHFDELLATLNAIEKGYQSQMKEAIQLAKTARRNAAITLISLVTLISISVMIVIYYFSHQLLLRLTTLNNHLKTLAQGQLIENFLNETADDEISEITLSLTQLNEALKNIIAQMRTIAAGHYTTELRLLSANDQLGQAILEMIRTLREVATQNAQQDWLKNGQAQLNEQMSGEHDVKVLAKNVISLLTTYLNAKVGLFYLLEEPDSREPYLKRVASYAYTQPATLPSTFALGEGLVGEVALTHKPIICTHTEEELTYIARSGLSQSVPHYVIILPILYEKITKGVIELGFADPITAIQEEFLSQVTTRIGIAVNTAKSRAEMRILLVQTQQQASELKLRQEEIQQANDELQTQTEELETQQEELRQINEELEQRTQDLEQQQIEVRDKNELLEQTQRQMEKAQKAIEIKAQELELASQYKSEFLANMSHELRTPLNSLLILAQLLVEDKESRLTPQQIEYARTIHNAGSDLLALINDILDLSKIEAGKTETTIEAISVADFVREIEQNFRPLAEKKGLTFTLLIHDDFPAAVYTDNQRLKQIVNNLLSNAFKFTTRGAVELTLYRPTPDTLVSMALKNVPFVALSVTDSGIGIPEDKQKIIFEAFQQVDGTTSRKYGGTGLGLSISRQLARLLGGTLKVTSTEGQGSTFTLYLPEQAIQVAPPLEPESALVHGKIAEGEVISAAADVQENLQSGNLTDMHLSKDQQIALQMVHNKDSILAQKKVLLVDDDVRNIFALTVVLDEKSMTVITAENGKEALALLEEHPDVAIVLMDIMMPEMDGYETIKRIRAQTHFHKLPIIALTAKAMKDDRGRCIEVGASDYLAKPVDTTKLLSLMRVWLYR